jgi:hypothetical protein
VRSLFEAAAKSAPLGRLKGEFMRIVFISVAAFVVGACAARQLRKPHMHQAIELLRDARQSLDRATSDKGGHRVTAMQLIDQAIAEVRAGIEFDDSH